MSKCPLKMIGNSTGYDCEEDCVLLGFRGCELSLALQAINEFTDQVCEEGIPIWTPRDLKIDGEIEIGAPTVELCGTVNVG